MATDILTAFTHRQEEAYHLFREKYLSRGGSNISAQGVAGVLDRIRYDKMARLEKIAKIAHMLRIDNGSVDASDLLEAMKKNNVSIDDARDDLLDIANYAVITLLLLDSNWG